MSVVNCKVKFIRPQYQNLEKWTEDENNVYVGRGGVVFINKQRFPKKASPFCNPFKVGKHGTRDEVIQKYKEYINLIKLFFHFIKKWKNLFLIKWKHSNLYTLEDFKY